MAPRTWTSSGSVTSFRAPTQRQGARRRDRARLCHEVGASRNGVQVQLQRDAPPAPFELRRQPEHVGECFVGERAQRKEVPDGPHAQLRGAALVRLHQAMHLLLADLERVDLVDRQQVVVSPGRNVLRVECLSLIHI
eukprot:2946034-Rhodomonas_salina.2